MFIEGYDRSTWSSEILELIGMDFMKLSISSMIGLNWPWGCSEALLPIWNRNPVLGVCAPVVVILYFPYVSLIVTTATHVSMAILHRSYSYSQRYALFAEEFRLNFCSFKPWFLFLGFWVLGFWLCSIPSHRGLWLVRMKLRFWSSLECISWSSDCL